MLQDKGFCREVWDQWKTYSASGGILTADVLKGYVEDQVNYLTTTGALARNNAKWVLPANTTYADQVSDLKTYLKERLAWMESKPDHNLKALLKSTSGFMPETKGV